MPSGKAKESRAFQSPSRYIQGPGELRNLPAFAANYGPTALAIIDTFFYPEYSVKIPELFQAAGMTAWTVEFSGASSDEALERLIAFCHTLPQIPDTFIGIGGGPDLRHQQGRGRHLPEGLFQRSHSSDHGCSHLHPYHYQ